MRSQLEAELADDAVDGLSRKYNEWLEKAMHDQNKTTHSWYNLFKEADEDGSGFITFDELEHVTRVKLKKGPSVISDAEVKALWCHLDVDNSNSIMPDEFG